MYPMKMPSRKYRKIRKFTHGFLTTFFKQFLSTSDSRQFSREQMASFPLSLVYLDPYITHIAT